MATGLNGLDIVNNTVYLQLTALNGLDGLIEACETLEQWMDDIAYSVNVVVDMTNTSLSVSTLTRLQQLYSYAHPNLDTLIIVHARPLVKFAFDSIRIPNHMAAPTLLFVDNIENARTYLADEDATMPAAPEFPSMR